MLKFFEHLFSSTKISQEALQNAGYEYQRLSSDPLCEAWYHPRTHVFVWQTSDGVWRLHSRDAGMIYRNFYTMEQLEKFIARFPVTA